MAAAVLTAVLAMTGLFAMASPASAEAVHPNAAKNVAASGGVNQITVSWVAPDTGEPATSYVLVVRDSAGNQVGDPVIVLAPATSTTITGVPAGTFYVEVFTHNAYPGFGGPTATSTVTVTNPTTTPTTPPVVNTLPYRPYANWTEMINKEYQFFTGCGSLGRGPRDDEKTFWLYNIANRPWDGTDYYNFNSFQYNRQRAEWARLTNGATFSATDDPSTVGVDERYITSANYETSIAYKALYAKEYANQTSIPSGGGFAPADNGAGGGIAGNNLLEAGEITAAQTAAKNYAKWGPVLIAEYATKVNTLAAEQATNDVYFARRANFVTQLAEDAEQTDGPAYRLYTAYFSRIPDFNGLCFWSNKLRSGWSLLDVSDFFVKSSEFTNTYGEYSTYGEEGSTDAAEFVALVYKNVLNRTPDGAGVAFWTRQLQTERYSPAEMMIGFSESQEFKNKMASKVGIGVAFAHLLGRMPSESEYVAADYNDTYFQTSPSNGWYGFPYNNFLYWTIVDSAEYIARAKA